MEAQAEKKNKRGRAYICGSCEYINERKRVVNHVYREHIAFHQAPYFCTLCQFRCTTRRELNNHLVGYKAHLKAMREVVKAGSIRPESDYLIESSAPYILTDKDLAVLDSGMTQLVWQQRAKKVTGDCRVVKEAMRVETVTSGSVLEVEKEKQQGVDHEKQVKVVEGSSEFPELDHFGGM